MNVFNWKFQIILSLSVNLSRHIAGSSLISECHCCYSHWWHPAIIQLCLSSDDDTGSIMRVVSAGVIVQDMGSCGIDIYIWLWAVVHDGSPFVEARQAGLVGAVVAVCLLLLALAKLGSSALIIRWTWNIIRNVFHFHGQILDWKYCVTLGNFSLNFSSFLFLFLFSLPLRICFMLNFATTRQIVCDRNVTWPGIFFPWWI